MDNKEFFTFGIPDIDCCISGFKKNSLTLIYGPSGSGKSIFVANIVGNWIKKDKHVVYLELDDDPRTVIDTIRRISGEINIDKAIKEKRITILDGFSSRMAPYKIHLKEITKPLTSMRPEDIVSFLRTEVDSIVSKGKETLVVIDSFNEILSTTEPGMASEFLKNIRAIIAKALNTPTIVVLHTDTDFMVEWLRSLEYFLDSVLLLDTIVDYDKGTIERKLLIKKVKGQIICLQPLNYEIIGGKIVFKEACKKEV